ncbi:MAG: TerB family tellurite resistance protein, partial [Pseudomonadota bacterium]
MSVQKKSGISTSRFFMWRAVFAMAHADGVVTAQEISFLNESTQSLPLSDAQREMLSRDITEQQDAAVMFAQVTDAGDREEFFVLARV